MTLTFLLRPQYLKKRIIFQHITIIRSLGRRLPTMYPTRTISHGCQIVHGDPLNERKNGLKEKLIWAIGNLTVSMATHKYKFN